MSTCPLTREQMELLVLDHQVHNPGPGDDVVELRFRPAYGTEVQSFFVLNDAVQRAISASAGQADDRLKRLLTWAHEDLNDADIRASGTQLQMARDNAWRRLEPYIDQVVELAFQQLTAQKSGSPEPCTRFKP